MLLSKLKEALIGIKAGRVTLGYPFALLLMVVSAVVPYLWFRRLGWL